MEMVISNHFLYTDLVPSSNWTNQFTNVWPWGCPQVDFLPWPWKNIFGDRHLRSHCLSSGNFPDFNAQHPSPPPEHNNYPLVNSNMVLKYPHFFSRKYIFMMMVLFSSQLMLVYRRVSWKFATNLSFQHWPPSGHPPAGVCGWMSLRKFAEECISYMLSFLVLMVEEIPSSNRSG